jgi:hypothetical protein
MQPPPGRLPAPTSWLVFQPLGWCSSLLVGVPAFWLKRSRMHLRNFHDIVVFFRVDSISFTRSRAQQPHKKIDGVSPLFTLDACRHGGMTELEESRADGRPGPCALRTRPHRPIAAMPRKR